jgi:outer membrane protein OmpA-like peptidoglycan-associated protein
MNEMYQSNGDFSRLKSLLLGEEQQALSDIEGTVRRHDLRIGDDQALQRSVASILADAFRDADVQNHRELAAAIAPVMVAAIRREIRNASDEVVDAMYPIMGRLIRAYVASALRDFIEETNRRIEGGLSARFIRLRIKSLATRTPYRTLLIREGQNLRVASIYLINRNSGTLLDAWNADPAAPDLRGDDHLIGGMLTAINNFAAESLAESESELRALDLGEARVFLRASAVHLIAIKTVGKGNRKIKRFIDQTLQQSLERFADAAQEAPQLVREVLPDIADTTTQFLAKHKQPPILALSVIAGLFLLGSLITYQHFQERAAIAAIDSNVRSIINQHQALQAFPLRIDVARDKRSVNVAGLVPSAADRELFLKTAAEKLQPVKIKSQLVVVPPLEQYLEMSGFIGALNAELRRTESEAARKTAEEASRTRSEISQLQQQLEQKSAALSDRLAELHRITQNPFLKLSQWVAMNAVFFAEEANYRDEALAIKTLGELRDLLAFSNARVRIVGYTDPTGTNEGNGTLAERRAQKVALDLERLGVSKDRMKVLGRSSIMLLSYDKGPFSSNRRVEFEIAYTGEPTEPKGEPLVSNGTRP